jgi:4-azaleucine resistance transporter AzlC
LLGYIPLGIAFGLMFAHAGYGIISGIISSVTIYSGTGQFMQSSFLTTTTALYEVALITIVLNARMMFYGLSFLERYKAVGFRKWYLMFALTDETYALLTSEPAPEGVSDGDYMLAVSALNHLYWITGSVIGIVVGMFANINTTGIDFVMTTLFVVLATDQWKAFKTHEPVFIGLICSVASLLIFGPDRFMIPALIAITVLLLVRRKKIEAKLPTCHPELDSGSSPSSEVEDE